MPKNVLIIGMPRSGTSMTTSIFVNKGFYIAENIEQEIRPGDEYNPNGYWEAKGLIQNNIEILNSTGFKPDNTWLYEEISEKQTSLIYKLTQNDEHIKFVETFNEHGPWVWKDPRLCYTLDYWWPLLNSKTTAVLLLKRSPHDIYQSFIRLKWRNNSVEDKNELYNRILNHIKAAEMTIIKYNIPHITINYSDYKKNPEETVRKINKLFNMDISKNDLGYVNKYNSSSFRGKINKISDVIGERLPVNLRTIIKSMVPSYIWKFINPNRHSN